MFCFQKSMDALFDAYMNVAMCEESCKIPNKSKTNKTRYQKELSECMNEQCKTQLKHLYKAMIDHLKELIKCTKNKDANKNTLSKELVDLRKEAEQISRTMDKSGYIRIQQIMDGLNKYYKLLE